MVKEFLFLVLTLSQTRVDTLAESVLNVDSTSAPTLTFARLSPIDYIQVIVKLAGPCAKLSEHFCFPSFYAVVYSFGMISRQGIIQVSNMVASC